VSSAMHMVMLSSVTLAAGVLMGCGEPTGAPVKADSTSVLGTFAGTLPCADCAGIRTKLTLYAEQPSGRPVRYELTETYVGTRDGDRVFNRTGRWTVLRGSASDADATVYQLDFDRPKTVRNFLKLGDDELRLLDRSQNEIPRQAPHSLHRVLKGFERIVA
jgi:copper homeostasis protein (lipoprotein)